MSSAMPKVKVYPLCSECRAPYVLRHGWDLRTGKELWIWQRDCKHKKAVPLSSASPRVRADRDPAIADADAALRDSDARGRTP